MHPTDPTPLDEVFQEGMKARRDGQSRHDNPYGAGSEKRREWNAGFCATVENEDDIEPDAEDGPADRFRG